RNEREVRAFGMALTRGVFYQLTTKIISVVKKLYGGCFPSRVVLLGSRLWHNTDPNSCRASTPQAEGCPSCRCTRTPSSLCLKKPPVWPVVPFPKAIPI